MLAHELRNPLAPLRNGLQVMKLAQGDGEAVEQARAMMERQLGQMVRLVDDLLDVSRITRGKLELRKERVDAGRGACSSAVETSRPLIEAARPRAHRRRCRRSRLSWTPTRPGWPRCSPTCSTTPPSTPSRAGASG